ncbi:MAG: hypothetical protein WCP45_06300 [Verrucomicrobiota bacterium]
MEIELKPLITPPDAQALWDHPLVLRHATAKPGQVPQSDTHCFSVPRWLDLTNFTPPCPPRSACRATPGWS